MRVAALFCTPKSVYRSIDGVDVFDQLRDARTFALDAPVVAHPPCRAWGKLSHFAKPRADERDLAHWAVHVVRFCGGVLEHPISSRLWREIGVGTYGLRDAFGGVLVPVHQSWWGHRAQKHTGLYIVGPVPELPHDGPVPTRICQGVSARMRERNSLTGRPIRGIGAPERMRTPPDLAHFLVSVAMASQ